MENTEFRKTLRLIHSMTVDAFFDGVEEKTYISNLEEILNNYKKFADEQVKPIRIEFDNIIEFPAFENDQVDEDRPFLK